MYSQYKIRIFYQKVIYPYPLAFKLIIMCEAELLLKIKYKIKFI